MLNKYLLILILLNSSASFASKARTAALQSVAHIGDIQSVVGTKPSNAFKFGEWATFEMGSSSGATSRAEGGFSKKLEDSMMGAYIGGTNTVVTASRAVSAGGNYLTTENPLRLFYAKMSGDLAWGLGVLHTSSKNNSSTTVNKKQEAMVLHASAYQDAWNAQLALGLTNTAAYSNGNASQEEKLTGKPSTTLSGGYKLDSLYFYGSYLVSGFKHEVGTSTAADRADTVMVLGFTQSHKVNKDDFFYGISYSSSVVNDTAAAPLSTSLGAANRTKSETITMPIIMGFEAEATSWMVLRGSITQNFNLLGIGKTKTENINTDNNTETVGSDNTTVKAGAGIKWDKFIVDGVIAVANQDGAAFGANGGAFLSTIGMTYFF